MVLIIGNGISGVTCARWVRKLSNQEITIVSDESDYFFSRTALMYIYMGHMRLQDTQPYEKRFWKENRINLHKGKVTFIDFQAQIAHFEDGQKIAYEKLVLATGSKSNKFGWKGQDLKGVHGLYHLQDLEAMENHSKGLKRAVIVGGGLIGIEMAEMFHSRHIPVTFLVRENSFWNNILPLEESEMINRHILEYGIDLRLSEELDEILDENQDGVVDAVRTKSGQEIACGFVGLTVGVSPNINFLNPPSPLYQGGVQRNFVSLKSPLDKGNLGDSLATNRGILVNEFLQTNIENVYAIGDCAELQHPQEGRRSIEAVWYTGRMMGETAAYNICGHQVAYKPRLWFNSAKFLDIEYQVYGDIQAKLPEHQETWYWEHEKGKKSIRINYDKESQAVVGFNLMGIRFRHEVCEKWILEKAPFDFVLKNLQKANFDPEFFPGLKF
jgi:NADPH-dependent 2,4-dienoyl-CoA reductase/sulfur reductase-like enzyme